VDDKNHPIPLSRRQFLVLSLGAATAATVPIHLAGSTLAPTPTPTPTSSPLDSFVKLSAILTGIDAAKLAPPVDAINIKQVYFDLAQQKAGSTFDQLLSLFNQNQDKTPEEIATLILTQSGAAIGNLGRTIMLLWYLGSWYDPSDPAKYDSINPPSSSVVSADAYTQGWVWRVAQSHPMGFSALRFGYWNQTPPPLSDFISSGDQS